MIAVHHPSREQLFVRTTAVLSSNTSIIVDTVLYINEDPTNNQQQNRHASRRSRKKKVERRKKNKSSSIDLHETFVLMELHFDNQKGESSTSDRDFHRGGGKFGTCTLNIHLYLFEKIAN